MDTRTKGSEVNIKIDFIEIRPRHDPNGDRLAVDDFVFQVNGSEQIVEVYWNAIKTLDRGQLPFDEAKLAAQELLRRHIDKYGNLPKGGRLTLDKDAMLTVADRLGGRQRFTRAT